MSHSKKYFSKLNYTLGEEDTRVEYEIIPDNVNCALVVAGSGSRVIPLIAKAPKKLFCVDVLEQQLFLTELRVELCRQLEFRDYVRFLGYPPEPMSAGERKKYFDKLNLRLEAKTFLKVFFEKHKWAEVIYMGRFEKMLIQLSQVNALLTGKKGKGIFKTKNLEEQRQYFNTQFPGKRWKLVLSLLGNSAVLNSLLYKGEFPQKNIPGSTYDNFKRIYNEIFTNVPLSDCFFGQMSFFGKIIDPKANLLEAQETVFEQAKAKLNQCTISYLCHDFHTAAGLIDEPIDFISLSDVPSFITDPEEEKNYLQKLEPFIKDEGIVITRGNLRVTKPDHKGFQKNNATYQEVIQSDSTRLWNIDVYQKRNLFRRDELN